MPPNVPPLASWTIDGQQLPALTAAVRNRVQDGTASPEELSAWVLDRIRHNTHHNVACSILQDHKVRKWIILDQA
jgi:hypothetical protein